MTPRLAAVSAVFFVAVTARADGESAAAAENLFVRARALMDGGDASAACPLFAESERLDPAVGTLLNLAECYEAVGRVASAWAAYRDMETLATRRGQSLRAEHAASKARELEPKLPYLTVSVAPRDRAPGLVVKRDAAPIAEAVWGVSIPVDPGRHHVVAHAEGHVDWDAWETVGLGEKKGIVVPPLAVASKPVAPRASSGSFAKPFGATLLGIGAAGVAAGLAFGAVALADDRTARADHCSAIDCDARGVELQSRAHDWATASTAVFFAGLGVATIGLVVWLLSPRSANVALGRWEARF